MRRIIDEFTHIPDVKKRWALRNPEYRAEYQLTFRKQNKPLMAKYNNEAYLKRRAVLDDLKKGPCTDCGIQYDPWVMQFDHRNPADKKFTISQINSVFKHLYEEVAKCDLVCANCHAQRTHKQQAAGLIKHYTGKPKGLSRGK